VQDIELASQKQLQLELKVHLNIITVEGDK
jgi:hypothetical protein